MKLSRFQGFVCVIALVASPAFADLPAEPSVASNAQPNQSPPVPDRKTKDLRSGPLAIVTKLYVGPIFPKGGSLNALANVDPGLASDLYLYSIGTFKRPTGDNTVTQAPSDNVPVAASTSAPPDKFTLTMSGSGATYAINTAAPKPEKKSATIIPNDCTYEGPRSKVPAPTSATEAFSYIDSNSEDKCGTAHKMELAKALIARSDMLCSQFVTKMDISQRGFRTAFGIIGTVVGFVGTVASPAKVFSGLAGVSSGINGDIDAGAFHGAEAYLLANAITSAQEEDRVALYGRLGIPVKSATIATSTSPTGTTSTTTAGSTTGNAVVTITFNPATLGTPGAPAKPAIAASHGKPGSAAVPKQLGTPPTPPSITLAIGSAPTAAGTKGSSTDGSGSGADLQYASIGTIFSEINKYHNGCSIRVGLNQLGNKLNTATPVKTSSVPTKQD